MTVTDFLFAHVSVVNSAPLYGLLALAAILCVGAHFGRQTGR